MSVASTRNSRTGDAELGSMTIGCRFGSGGVGRIMAGPLIIDASGDPKMMFEEDLEMPGGGGGNGQGENFFLSVTELPLPGCFGVSQRMEWKDWPIPAMDSGELEPTAPSRDA